MCAALALASCGAPQPQAPRAQAARIAAALSQIAQACGESYQERAFHANPPGVAALDAKASVRARELAAVLHANPSWVYQGKTVTQIVVMAAGYLRECGLTRAAKVLGAR